VQDDEVTVGSTRRNSTRLRELARHVLENLVERSFATLTEKQIKRGTNMRVLEDHRSYLASTNEAPTPFVWTKTADDHPRWYREIVSANL